jgi:hypothetical protein
MEKRGSEKEEKVTWLFLKFTSQQCVSTHWHGQLFRESRTRLPAQNDGNAVQNGFSTAGLPS